MCLWLLGMLAVWDCGGEYGGAGDDSAWDFFWGEMICDLGF